MFLTWLIFCDLTPFELAGFYFIRISVRLSDQVFMNLEFFVNVVAEIFMGQMLFFTPNFLTKVKVFLIQISFFFSLISYLIKA